MVDTSRRQLLAAGGVVALAGCLSSDDGDEPSEPVPEAAESSLLGMIPIEVDGTELAEVYHSEQSPREQAVSRLVFTAGVAEEFGLDENEVDETALVFYPEPDEESFAGAWLLAGSFDADEPVVDNEMESEAAIQREDGLLIAAFREVETEDAPEQAPAVRTAIEEARDGERETVLDEDTVARAYEPLDDPPFTTLTPRPESDALFGRVGREFPVAADRIDALAHGSTPTGDRTINETIVLALDNSPEADDIESVQEHVEAQHSGDGDPEVRDDGQLLVAEYRYESAPRPDRSASPDGRISTRYYDEEGVATLRYRGSEPVPADELHGFVEDEPVTLDWGTDRVEEGDTAELSVEPLSSVRVEWQSPDDEDTFDTFTRGVVYDTTPFASRYDDDENTVVFSYEGRPIDRTDRLKLTHRPDGDRQAETAESVDSRTDRLEAGDELVVEGVEFDDRVMLSATHDHERGARQSSIIIHTVDPAGRFRLDHGQPAVSYTDGTPHDASEFSIAVNGERTARQFEDEYGTLERGDEMRVDATPGDVVTVEWHGDEAVHKRLEQIVQPPASFNLYRDGEEYHLQYTSDEPWAADAFALAGPEGVSTQALENEYDTLEDGDSVALELSQTDSVNVDYVGGPEPVTVARLRPRSTADFDLVVDNGTATLSFDANGEWPADAFGVLVDGEERGPLFATEYDTVTRGDDVTVDAERGDRVTVVIEANERDRPVFRERALPDVSVEAQGGDDGIELTLESETQVAADRLRLAVDGPSRRGKEIDPWGDTGTVEPGTAVTVDVTIDGRDVLVVMYDNHRLSTVRADEISD